MCPSCQNARREENTKKALLVAASQNHDVVYASYDTNFYSLKKLNHVLDRSVASWQASLDRRSFHKCVHKYARGLRLIPDHESGMARVRTSVLISVAPRTFADPMDWVQSWLTGCGAIEMALVVSPDERLCLEAARRVATVGVTADDICEMRDGRIYCDENKLVLFRDALSGRRLIAFSRAISPD